MERVLSAAMLPTPACHAGAAGIWAAGACIDLVSQRQHNKTMGPYVSELVAATLQVMRMLPVRGVARDGARLGTDLRLVAGRRWQPATACTYLLFLFYC